MKKLLGCTLLIVSCVTSVMAFANIVPQRLDQVILRLSAEQWIKTEDAKVYVTINASLNNQDLVTLRTAILSSLQRIAVGDWHITQFTRTQDSSGLENVFAQAEVRLDNGKIAKIRQTAESISRPGLTYRIANIDFSPSLAAVEAGHVAARAQIYNQINVEVAQLNKSFPKQNYSITQVSFVPMMFATEAADEMSMQKQGVMAPMSARMAGGMPSMSISQNIVETATVVLASQRATPTNA